MLVHNLSERWADYMVANGAPKDSREIYVYGLECTLNELICDVILIAAAVCMKRVWEMACFIVVFNFLRMAVGGYHASSPFCCLFGSIAAGVVCVAVYPVLVGRRLAELFLSAVCVGIVWKTAPVVHTKHPVSEKRQKTVRKLARMMIIGTGLLILALGNSFPEPAAMICVTCVCTCALALAGKYQTAAT